MDEELANIVNSLLKDKIPHEKTQAKVDQYPNPANIEGLRTPRVNPLIWSQLPAQVRTQDSKHQKSQNSLVAAVVAIREFNGDYGLRTTAVRAFSFVCSTGLSRANTER